LKTLDSGFRRNDVKQHQTNFFTASGDAGEGGAGLGICFIESPYLPFLIAQEGQWLLVPWRLSR